MAANIDKYNIKIHPLNEYRSATVKSNTVSSKFHLIRSLFEIFAKFLLFHVENAQLI